MSLQCRKSKKNLYIYVFSLKLEVSKFKEFTLLPSLLFLDQLPIGAYCQFNNPLDNCGWHSTRNNSIVTIKNGSLYIQLSPKTKFGDGIGIKSPEFPALPLFNSLESSKYFQSCRVILIFTFFFLIFLGD